MGLLNIILAYLLGSIPTAVWLSKNFYGSDIRTHGSGNAGSTNMYRTFGFKAGFITQLIDILKGYLAALLPVLWLNSFNTLFEQLVFQLACGIAAILGHTFTIFAQFKGGKGINTILGMMIALNPIGSFIGIATFIVVLLYCKMVSLSSIIAVASFSIYILIQILLSPLEASQHNSYLFLGIGLLLLVYVVYSHRTNITRILNGTERKVDLIDKLRKVI